MTASEKSFLGLAKQTAKGTPNTTDAQFQYIMFSEGALGPNNVFLPLDQEIGGGALLRNIIKAGVSSGGAVTFIPRPNSLGKFLIGTLGKCAAPVSHLPNPPNDACFTHVFTLDSADQFLAPYWTVRSAPGNLLGEQLQDMRIAALGLTWKAADYVRGTLAFMGGLPTQLATTNWAVPTYLDKTAQFIAPLMDIELPTASDLKVLGGSFAIGLQIPLDDQWMTGSYSPDDFDINSKMFVLSLNIKVTDAALYKKMAYDPAASTAWVAAMYREADFKLYFASDQLAEASIPFNMTIAANGQNAASGNANVVWTCTPLAMRAGRQVLMNVTGTWLGDNAALEPITITLDNTWPTQY